MKKIICAILSVLMLVSLTACGAAPAADDGIVKVAIVQQLDHSSLNEIRDAIKAELDANDSMTFQVDVFNGQNDASVLNQIGADVVSDGYDLIIPIATMAAQCMITANEDAGIPIVFSAVSDPEAAGLTGLDKVTGVSDALNTPFILEMMLAAQPDIQTVGLLYSNSEINSATPIAQAKAYLDAKGIAYIEKTGNAVDEVIAAASALVGQCDAVFTPTDNAIMNAETSVAEILADAGIPHYTGADSFVTAGAFATCGVNYTELGTKTAQIAVSALQTGEFPAFHLMDGGIITVNTETAAKLNLDYRVFAEMANTLVEVTTG